MFMVICHKKNDPEKIFIYSKIVNVKTTIIYNFFIAFYD